LARSAKLIGGFQPVITLPTLILKFVGDGQEERFNCTGFEGPFTIFISSWSIDDRWDEGGSAGNWSLYHCTLVADLGVGVGAGASLRVIPVIVFYCVVVYININYTIKLSIFSIFMDIIDNLMTLVFTSLLQHYLQKRGGVMCMSV
jgi:hypothetical protein